MTHASFTGGLWRVRPRAHRAAQARVLERELLDAGEQHAVQMILPAEVLLPVFEEPSRERQQQPPLREEDDASDGRTMRRQLEVGPEPPVDVAVEQLGQERRVEVALVD